MRGWGQLPESPDLFWWVIRKKAFGKSTQLQGLTDADRSLAKVSVRVTGGKWGRKRDEDPNGASSWPVKHGGDGVVTGTWRTHRTSSLLT